ncbi:hypothetical protein ACH4U3_04290 [Streptomyces griseoruber]|uniref:hypothetical protein n=1 Tax=Streptomyces griseoruber TaxID=1943 RepID=UPI00378E7B4E
MARKTTIIITGDHSGDVAGTVISGTTGPVALNGNVYDGTTQQDSHDTGRRTFSGTGMTVIEGDNHGGISRSF